MASHKVTLNLSLEAQSSLEFVSLSKDVYVQLYGSKNEGTKIDIKNKFVSVTLEGSNILEKFQIYPITVKDSLPENSIEIESMKLLQKYASEFTVEFAKISKVDDIPKLSHVVLGFPDEVYEILENKSNEYIYKILAQEREYKEGDKIMIKKGDICHMLNGEVINAEPYRQGFLDVSTATTIVKYESENIDENIGETEDYNYDLFGVDVMTNSIVFNNTTDDYTNFEVKPLKKNELLKYTQFSKYCNEFPMEDDTLFACLSFQAFQKLHCLSGDMLLIEHNGKPIYIRVFPFIGPSSFESDSIYLSPLLIIALNNPEKVNVRWLCQTHQRVDVPRYKLSKYIPLIKDITLARVATPVTTDRTLQYLFLSNLKYHFEGAHRVLMKDQLIPIAIDSTLARSIHHTYSEKGWYPEVIPDGDLDSIAWFKVTDGTCKNEEGDIVPIESGKQYFVNSQKTRMLQSGVVNCDLGHINMSVIKEYMGISTLFDYKNIKLAGKPGYSFNYAYKIRKIFNTSVQTKGKIDLRTTIMLTSNTRFVGKANVVKSICEEYGFSLVELDSYSLLNDGMGLPAVTVGIIRGKLDKLVESCDKLAIFIKHIEAICKKGDEQQATQKSMDDSLSLKIIQLIEEYTQKGVIFIASTCSPDDCNDIFRSKIKFEIDVGVPSEIERKQIFEYLVKFEKLGSRNLNNSDKYDKYQYVADSDVNIDTLALQSAALTPNDLIFIVKNVKLNALNRIKKEKKGLNTSFEDVIKLNEGIVSLTSKDFEESINKARNKFSDSIGAPRIPNVKWEDVGGLDVVKNEILDTIEMPLKHPELFGSGMKKRSGLLFYGPPGTGKTLLAKAIATNFSLNFFSVKGPELLNMYIGESEANVRRVFEKARDAKPCVIFFDELDSVAPRRGNQGDSGGVMDRIVSQLLAELDGMSGSDGGDGVFVVGASNRPDLLDEALLRPGRFDKMLYLGISDTHEKQAKIIEALTRKFNLDPSVNLHKVAETCPYNFTGADFYALCSDAMLNAMIRTAGEVDKKLEIYNKENPEKPLNTRQWFEKVSKPQDLDVLVDTVDFDKARADLVASVSDQELAHYLRVRENFEGGKK